MKRPTLYQCNECRCVYRVYHRDVKLCPKCGSPDRHVIKAQPVEALPFIKRGAK